MNLLEDKFLTLKQLSYKVTRLMSLTSAGRSSEICKLDTEFTNVEQEKIVFTVTELTKTRKVFDKPLQMTFHIHRESKLNVRDCILSYLEKTKNLRENESKLLISFMKPHKSVKPCTAAGWLKNMLKEAGIDTEVFKPHSTGGASTSKAHKFGLSLQQIMNKAN